MPDNATATTAIAPPWALVLGSTSPDVEFFLSLIIVEVVVVPREVLVVLYLLPFLRFPK